MNDDLYSDRPGDSEWPAEPPAGQGWDPEDPEEYAYRRDREAAARELPRPATVGARVGAYVIDLVLLVVVVVLLASLGFDGGLVPATAEGAEPRSTYASGILFAVLTLAYFVVMETATGQTLGKRLLRIRATMADGSDMTWDAALKRRVLFVIGAVVPTVGILFGWFAVPLAALVTAAQDPTMHQGFHDRWAATRVVDV